VESKLANQPVAQYQLFDLSQDPAEKHDVLDKYPDVADRLKVQLADIIKTGEKKPHVVGSK
jgi:arylsulfatase A